ncbi:MAG: amidophosphoribosyltransferase [Bacteroidales bacterium]|jgi:amidophosphoribosyltransferase|nr:amidophosphoribosyltransferase [Bacteroidales bacterium]
MEQLKHECGVALIRLRKPLEYYAEKYGTSNYALNKLYLLMQKQHNRGQEGAGIACVSLSAEPGEEFMFRERKEGKNAIPELFSSIGEQINDFSGECYMGHLRYSTTGRSGLTYVHPHLRRSNYRKNTLALCGNFNLTNVDEIFKHLKSLNQHPRRTSDTTILLEQLGYSLDTNGGDTQAIIRECMPMWDGGFVLCGMTGTGEMFAARDPWGIRTAFYYADDEVIIIASERPAIQTVMDVEVDSVKEIKAGETLFISASGEMSCVPIISDKKATPCVFERIYFSRGGDQDIYRERKDLGRALVPQILEAIDYDLENSVFSFIPNTAEIAFMGMIEGLNEHLNQEKCRAIANLKSNNPLDIEKIISQRIRSEKVAIKDIKLRTFISETGERNELANHVYDITYGSIRPGIDNLVVIDDSIVRGTTLKQSIITILARLFPKKLIIVSSAPQIRYPDFYGIDMSNIGDLIAFRAALALSDKNKIEEVYRKCANENTALQNYVSEIYEPFSDKEISQKIAELLTPEDVTCPVEIIFQQRDELTQICKDHSGDWYFSGNYPTKGGVRRVNEALVHDACKKENK